MQKQKYSDTENKTTFFKNDFFFNLKIFMKQKKQRSPLVCLFFLTLQSSHNILCLEV